MSNNNHNVYDHLPVYPLKLSQAALDAAQYAQEQVNSLSTLLTDTALSVMSTDISHLLKDASNYLSDEAVKHIGSISKTVSSISSEAMRDAADSTLTLVNSIPQSMIDNIAFINTAVASIKGINFGTIAAQHLQVNYEQYKPVVDALEGLQRGNNEGIPFDLIPEDSPSETSAENTLTAIKEHKPVNVIAIIGLILSIYNTMLGSYTGLLKPSTASEQLQVDKDQLKQSQLDYAENVRHNAVMEAYAEESAERDKLQLMFMGQMYELLINLTKPEIESVPEED